MALFRPRWTPRRRVFGTGSGRYHHTTADELHRAAARARTWAPTWRAAAEGTGLVRTVYVAAGVTTVIPTLTRVDDTPAGLVLRVRALPGQVPDDYRAVASRLAHALRCSRVRVDQAHGGAIVVLTLLDADPLERAVRHSPRAPRGFLGVADDGRGLAVPWHRRGHMIVQGQTGSGKSVFTYGQLADAANDPAVLVTGLDPSGLLWRPFSGTRHADWQVGGLTADLAAHVALLERLVADMDDRITRIPFDRDAVELSADLPVVLVVLEEYPGLLRAADLVDKRTGGRVRALVARLLSEGRKAGYRVLLVCQRADATVVDGLVRAQCAFRVSFSVDSGEAVRMLHPAVADPADVLAAPPGIALVTRPGKPLERMRAPLLDYARYAALVRGSAA